MTGSRTDLPDASAETAIVVDALRQSIAELRRSNEELEQFAHVVSHDLREPLRMVTAYAQLLSRRYAGRLDDDADQFIAYITEGAHRMERLIDDILDFSRVGRAECHRAPLDSRLALDAALADLQPRIAESQARLTIAAMPRILADEVQMERLFANLVGNALKYHRPGVPPEILVRGEECDEGWHFSVADNGEGIAPADQERVFMVFARLHGKDNPGTGLGLAICKKIVERHGGRIWVESVPGRGSTFHFVLAK